jgi:hypothetical protein
MSQDNPNFWKTHLAAAITGLALGVGITSYYGLDLKNEQEDRIAALRRDLDSCLDAKGSLEEELEAIKARRKQDFEVVRDLRDKNRKMNMWMEWLMGQERELMEEKKHVNACIDSGEQLDALASIPDDFEISDEARERMAELMRKGCKVDGIVAGNVRFSPVVNCDFSMVSTENDPGRDYYARDSFGRELNEAEEEIVSALEERKYQNVIDKVSPEAMREEVDSAMGRTGAPEEVRTAMNDLIDKTDQYQQNPGDFDTKCQMLIAFSKLKELPHLDPLFFDGQVSLSMFLEAVEEGGIKMSDAEIKRCFEGQGSQ